MITFNHKDSISQIEQKIMKYETVAKFYERNYAEGRFQSKEGRKRIFDEITTELKNPQKEKHLSK